MQLLRNLPIFTVSFAASLGHLIFPGLSFNYSKALTVVSKGAEGLARNYLCSRTSADKCCRKRTVTTWRRGQVNREASAYCYIRYVIYEPGISMYLDLYFLNDSLPINTLIVHICQFPSSLSI